MLRRATTFILGAGASCEVGLPSGEDLQQKIASLLFIDSNERTFRNERVRDAAQVLMAKSGKNRAARHGELSIAASKIVQAMPVSASIDNFLHTHREDADVVILGKLAIAISILEAERTSAVGTLARSRGVGDWGNNEKLKASWYPAFAKMITAGSQHDDPSSMFKNIKFVVFNYDRCLEFMLHQIIMRYFSIDGNQVLAVLENIEITHPYGSLGRIGFNNGVGITIGDEYADYLQISDSIKTFTEAVEAETINRAKRAISQADTLVFFGFGFLPQNMELLKPLDRSYVKRVFATTYGISTYDKDVVEQGLRQFVDPSERSSMLSLGGWVHNRGVPFVDIENTSCRNLVDNHRFRLIDDYI